MKKLVSMYQKYMFRPILYKSVTRVSVVVRADAAVGPLCQRRHLYHVAGPGSAAGGSSCWHGPGGITCGWTGSPSITWRKNSRGWQKKKKRHATKSIVDYADERIVSFEELEPEERVFCSCCPT